MAVNVVYLNGEKIIDLSQDTVVQESVVEDFVFHDSEGNVKVGTRNPYGGDYMPEGTVEISTNKTEGGFYVRDVEYAKVNVPPKYYDEGSKEEPHEIEYGQVAHYVQQGMESIPNTNEFKYKALGNVWVKTKPFTETKTIAGVEIESETSDAAYTKEVDVEKYKSAKLKLQINSLTVSPSEAGIVVGGFETKFDQANYAGLAKTYISVDMRGFMKTPDPNKTIPLTKQGESVNVRDYSKAVVQLEEYDGKSSISALTYTYNG